MKSNTRAKMLVSAAAAAALLLTGCSSTATPAQPGGEAGGDPVKIQIGFENTADEPIGQAAERWAELVAERSGGSLELELFPNSALGSKNELIDQMVMGENVVTIADGAFFADYGVPDMGILYGPFFFDTWDDVWTLIESDWYAEQATKLEEKGLTLLSSNWVYGERHLMSNKPVATPDDLAGMKIRLANAKVYIEGFKALGATPVGMDLGDVYGALETGVIDGVENPLSTLYGRSFQEVSKNLLKTGHIKNFSTWVAGSSFMSTLTEEQREVLTATAEEAGLYNNELQAAAGSEYEQLLVDAGVAVSEMTPEAAKQWKAAGESFYELGDDFGWSEGLYETAKKAMGN